VRRVGRGAVLCAIASVAFAMGCASDDEDRASGVSENDALAANDGDVHPAKRDRGERDGEAEDPAARDRSSSPPLKTATCPPEAGNCRSATGRVLYVERVDPDGDGDAHFVLASRDSITGPGITVIDVKRSLRPSPLPGRGDRLSAAGPVYRGSYGQRQIEAVELHVARTR
jgi:hypothetical protein